ncbi:DUF6503 family protein [Luteirhabdus pelagi]|uniref:DUF6503 family protein n=1 Tax=Luteirhabdus pelagi TaxID=2792783 RepID=UPI001F3D1F91|nr:DUF6503 family protein [Luteirhabdus pelagi]
MEKNVMRSISLIIVIAFLFSCEEEKKQPTVDEIIATAIAEACSGNCEDATITFSFRDKDYRSERSNGRFQLERLFIDSIGRVRDVLNNEGFTRYVNDSVVTLVDSSERIFGDAVNSVHYFAQLPFGLNAGAAKKKLLGKDTIKGKPYYEIQVTFAEEGGGTDFEDEFLYWIHTEDFTVDYLAYRYHTEGGGIRFREAYNPRIIEGIRFVDYRNYKTDSLFIPLQQLDEKFEKGALPLLSTIETENVTVSLPKKN